MNLTRFWSAVAGSRRELTPTEIFSQARRVRDRGRFEEAVALVTTGLARDPDSIAGRMLSGSLHVIFREMEPAKADFERVLAADRHQPRALLGLARIALEEGDAARCTLLLRRALERFPDFPEVQALLEVISVQAAAPPRPAPAPEPTHELQVPPINHELMLQSPDGALLVAHPSAVSHEASAAHVHQVLQLADAIAVRCGYGTIRRAVLEGAAETVYVRRDASHVLSMMVRTDLDADLVTGHLDRLWEATTESPAPAP